MKLVFKNRWNLLLLALLLTACNHKAYLFTSFHEPADKGLRLLYSYDGFHWKDFDTVFLKPTVGASKIMRDPSMIQSADGVFHLVWTTEWKGGTGFGYAESKDLLHWTKEAYIPVMQKEKFVANVWAPELFYDDKSKNNLIVWATCIPGRFEKGLEADSNNHRLYYTATKDFSKFSETKLFLDPHFSVIDAVIVKKEEGKYVLVLKDNTRPERNIKVAFANQAEGPYENVSAPFTEKFTEGPAVVKVKGGWLIYYDVYQKKKYGASFTKDFQTFINADSLIEIPEGHKHGTIVPVSKRIIKDLLKATKIN